MKNSIDEENIECQICGEHFLSNLAIIHQNKCRRNLRKQNLNKNTNTNNNSQINSPTIEKDKDVLREPENTENIDNIESNLELVFNIESNINNPPKNEELIYNGMNTLTNLEVEKNSNYNNKTLSKSINKNKKYREKLKSLDDGIIQCRALVKDFPKLNTDDFNVHLNTESNLNNKNSNLDNNNFEVINNIQEDLSYIQFNENNKKNNNSDNGYHNKDNSSNNESRVKSQDNHEMLYYSNENNYNNHNKNNSNKIINEQLNNLDIYTKELDNTNMSIIQTNTNLDNNTEIEDKNFLNKLENEEKKQTLIMNTEYEELSKLESSLQFDKRLVHEKWQIRKNAFIQLSDILINSSILLHKKLNSLFKDNSSLENSQELKEVQEIIETYILFYPWMKYLVTDSNISSLQQGLLTFKVYLQILPNEIFDVNNILNISQIEKIKKFMIELFIEEVEKLISYNKFGINNLVLEIINYILNINDFTIFVKHYLKNENLESQNSYTINYINQSQLFNIIQDLIKKLISFNNNKSFSIVLKFIEDEIIGCIYLHYNNIYSRFKSKKVSDQYYKNTIKSILEISFQILFELDNSIYYIENGNSSSSLDDKELIGSLGLKAITKSHDLILIKNKYSERKKCLTGFLTNVLDHVSDSNFVLINNIKSIKHCLSFLKENLDNFNSIEQLKQYNSSNTNKLHHVYLNLIYTVFSKRTNLNNQVFYFNLFDFERTILSESNNISLLTTQNNEKIVNKINSNINTKKPKVSKKVQENNTSNNILNSNINDLFSEDFFKFPYLNNFQLKKDVLQGLLSNFKKTSFVEKIQQIVFDSIENSYTNNIMSHTNLKEILNVLNYSIEDTNVLIYIKSLELLKILLKITVINLNTTNEVKRVNLIISNKLFNKLKILLASATGKLKEKKNNVKVCVFELFHEVISSEAFSSKLEFINWLLKECCITNNNSTQKKSSISPDLKKSILEFIFHITSGFLEERLEVLYEFVGLLCIMILNENIQQIKDLCCSIILSVKDPLVSIDNNKFYELIKDLPEIRKKQLISNDASQNIHKPDNEEVNNSNILNNNKSEENLISHEKDIARKDNNEFLNGEDLSQINNNDLNVTNNENEISKYSNHNEIENISDNDNEKEFKNNKKNSNMIKNEVFYDNKIEVSNEKNLQLNVAMKNNLEENNIKAQEDLLENKNENVDPDFIKNPKLKSRLIKSLSYIDSLNEEQIEIYSSEVINSFLSFLGKVCNETSNENLNEHFIVILKIIEKILSQNQVVKYDILDKILWVILFGFSFFVSIENTDETSFYYSLMYKCFVNINNTVSSVKFTEVLNEDNKHKLINLVAYSILRFLKSFPIKENLLKKTVTKEEMFYNYLKLLLIEKIGNSIYDLVFFKESILIKELESIISNSPFLILRKKIEILKSLNIESDVFKKINSTITEKTENSSNEKTPKFSLMDNFKLDNSITKLNLQDATIDSNIVSIVSTIQKTEDFGKHINEYEADTFLDNIKTLIYKIPGALQEDGYLIIQLLIDIEQKITGIKIESDGETNEKNFNLKLKILELLSSILEQNTFFIKKCSLNIFIHLLDMMIKVLDDLIYIKSICTSKTEEALNFKLIVKTQETIENIIIKGRQNLSNVFQSLLVVLNKNFPSNFNEKLERKKLIILQCMCYLFKMSLKNKTINSNKENSLDTYTLLSELNDFFYVYPPNMLNSSTPNLKEFDSIYQCFKKLTDLCIKESKVQAEKFYKDQSFKLKNGSGNISQIILDYLENSLTSGSFN